MVPVCLQEDYPVGACTAHFLWSRLVIVGIGHMPNLLCSQNGQVLVDELGAAIQTGEHSVPYFPSSYIDVINFLACVLLCRCW
jgi:hypothetical protein